MTERTHVAKTADPIILLEVGQNHILSESGKPRGFWYEVDGDWRRWCHGERWNVENLLHLHSVDLGNCNVLKIQTVEELDKFHEEHGFEVYPDRPCLVSIRWSEVAEKYDGIEIAPYRWERRPGYLWYYGWDCASGVIWRPKDAVATYVGPCPIPILEESNS